MREYGRGGWISELTVWPPVNVFSAEVNTKRMRDTIAVKRESHWEISDKSWLSYIYCSQFVITLLIICGYIGQFVPMSFTIKIGSTHLFYSIEKHEKDINTDEDQWVLGLIDKIRFPNDDARQSPPNVVTLKVLYKFFHHLTIMSSFFGLWVDYSYFYLSLLSHVSPWPWL